MFKVYMLDSLSPIEWSQAAWRIEGPAAVSTDECEQKLIGPLLLERLPRDGLIVDAGCGTGKWVLYLRRHGYRVVGIDISRDAAGIARAAQAELPLIVADTKRAPLRDHSVDAVLSLGVVEHDEAGPLEGLRELRRILKPDGLLVLDVPYNSPARRLVLNHLQRWVTRRRRRAGWKLAFAEYRFALPELRAVLARAGFEVLGAYPDDMRPPHNLGFWVDYQNLTFDPFRPPAPQQLFRLAGWKGALAAALTRWAPWAVCGEVALLARPRADEP